MIRAYKRAMHRDEAPCRQWISIDVTYLAINLIKRRLKDASDEELQFEGKGPDHRFRQRATRNQATEADGVDLRENRSPSR